MLNRRSRYCSHIDWIPRGSPSLVAIRMSTELPHDLPIPREDLAMTMDDDPAHVQVALRRSLTVGPLLLYGLAVIVGAGICVAIATVIGRAGAAAP